MRDFVYFFQKGGLGFILVGLLIYIITNKEVNIGLTLTNPGQTAALVKEEPLAMAPENKEPSVLSSLFPKSRETFKDDLEHISEHKQKKYIQRFGHVAVNEMEKYGIPASVILASALLHSQAGEGHLARKGVNNHFAVPCTKDWRDESSEYKGRCFRHYDNAWMSFRDHSKFLTSEHFPANQNLNPIDYKGWAKALGKMNYSPYPKLSKKLLRIIRDYNLIVFDQKK